MTKLIKNEKKEIYFLSSFETNNSAQPNKIKFFTYSPIEHKFLQKKKFEVIKTKKHKNKNTLNKYITHGYWDKYEHNRFIEALYLYNCKWHKIQAYLKVRSYKQIRSHAQKFYLKLKSFEDKKLGLNFTSPNVDNLNQIIKIIKEKELNDENCGKLLYIISKKIAFGKNVSNEKLDKRIDEKYFNKKEEKQLKNCENINNGNNNKNNNIFSNLSSEDLSIEISDKKLRNQTLNSLNFDNLYSHIEDNWDNNLTINSNIGNDPIFLQGILPYANL